MLKTLIKKLANRVGYDLVKKGKLGPHGYLDSDEFRYILWLDRIYQKISTVPGNIVEVGVAYGRNAILLGHMIRMNGDDASRRYYGFDTFEGYTEEDIKTDPHLSSTAWKQLDYTVVYNRIKSRGLADLCTLVKGDIRDTAERFVNSGGRNFQPSHLKIALLYIDCNAYEAALFSMRFFHSFMVPGGIICIDEKLQGGETRALHEFATENDYRVVKDPGPFAVPAYVCVAHPPITKNPS